jgi:hypothetical protein
LSGLGSNLYPAFGTAFHVGIVTFRVAAVMPVVGCLGLRLGLRHFLLDINRGRRGNRDYRWIRCYGIAVPSVSISPIPISSISSVSIDRGTIIGGTAPIVTQA